MRLSLRNIFGLLALILADFSSVALSQAPEKRIALVIGNAGYQAAPLQTTANDAGLIAQTLQAAGFDVVGARDLDQDSLRRTLRDFLDKAQASGSDTVAFIYFGGYGLQLEGENYIVPVDARIARDTEIPAEAVRLSDYTRSLAALNLKASFLVLDAARMNPFAKSGPSIAGGLALVEPGPGMLIAFNAAPGTVAPEGTGPYGAYAQALTEMLREGGLSLGDLFDRVRLRVNELTKGAALPWDVSHIQTNFVFFERAADAPPPQVTADQTSAFRARPIRDLGAQDAYTAALERDTLQGYDEFLATYPGDPLAKRVRAMIAARREALTWRRTRSIDTPPAYWSYLRRYPRGPHADDARRRLSFLAAMLEPPPTFVPIDYDEAPPPEDEFVYIDRPALAFDDPTFGFVPPPPAPIFFLPPPPFYFVALEPPPPPFGVFLLPVPIFVPVPLWVNAPVYVAPPPNNIIYQNIHNKVVINRTNNTVLITKPSGQTQTIKPFVTLPSSFGANAAALAPALPPSVAQKATLIQNQNIQTGKPVLGQPNAVLPNQAAPQPGQLHNFKNQAVGKSLPGTGGQPLPQVNGKSVLPTTQQLNDQQKLQQLKIQQQQVDQQKLQQLKIQQQQIDQQKLQQQNDQQKLQQLKIQQQQSDQQKLQQLKIQQQQIDQRKLQQQQQIQQQQGFQQQQIQRAPSPPAPPAGKPQKSTCGQPGLPACR
jgi:uncharacterized caspase-like protein